MGSRINELAQGTSGLRYQTDAVVVMERSQTVRLWFRKRAFQRQ